MLVSVKPKTSGLNRYITSSFFITVIYRNFLFPLVFALTLSMLVFPSFAQSASQVFGCQRYASDVVHCDLMLNEMQGYEVGGNATVVHPLSSGQSIFVEGRFANATEMRAEFRQSIEIMNTVELNPEAFTVAFWLKQPRSEPYSHIVSHTNRAQNAGWFFDTFAGENAQGSPTSSLRFGVPNSNGTIFAPDEVSLNAGDEFVHIAGTFDGTELIIYKDGAEAGTATFGGNYTVDPGVPVRIGSAAYCSSCNRWSGIIDDVQIYDRALEPEEVSQIHKATDELDGIIGHWTFDKDTSDALGDHHGSSTTIITSMAFSPDGRLFISEKNTGEVRVMSPEFRLQDEPFAHVDDVYASWEQGMLGIAIDPDFEENHYVYLYYTALAGTEDGNGGKVMNRLVRFTDEGSKGTDMVVLMDDIPASRGYHSGGALAFGLDGKLYVTVGDATEHIFAQDPAISVGKILRINKDGSIPTDNPYPGSPVYTIGHRNMFGIAFDSDGTGMITENGDFHYDELNIVIKGANYGFPTLQPPNLPPERVNNTSIKPVRSYWDAIAPTQMIYYTGGSIPDLKDKFLFGSFTGDLYAVRLSENKTKIEEEHKIDLGLFPFVPTVAVAQSPDGGIYFGGYQIYRLDSISEPTRNVHQVIVDTPDGMVISDLQLDLENSKMVIDAAIGDRIESDDMLTVRIPKGLITDITAIRMESPESMTLEYTLDNSNPDHDIVKVALDGSGPDDTKIAIIGAQIMPEFPTPLLIMTVTIISAVTSALILRRV